jgi:phospholipase C
MGELLIDLFPKSISDFETAVTNNSLPPVSFVGANTGATEGPLHTPAQNDDHAPTNVLLGEAFLYRIVNAVATSSLWSSTAIFITWDENGGFYDHVQPPCACDPSPQPLRDYRFDQYGFRVPLVIVSPFVHPGYVSHYDTDHASILRFIEHWRGLPALTKRDANAWPFLDVFDFSLDTAPPQLPPPPDAGSCFRADAGAQ